MLWTIALILFVLWLFGIVTGYSFDGFINILLILAIIAVVVNLFRGVRT